MSSSAGMLGSSCGSMRVLAGRAAAVYHIAGAEKDLRINSMLRPGTP
jgi:hypothetical protein